jgi:peptide/nickel transport system ATP-binding protein
MTTTSGTGRGRGAVAKPANATTSGGGSNGALLEVTDLSTWFPVPTGMVHAVDDVSFLLHRGETLGIVGESGSGKSVLARTIMRLTPRSASTTGSVKFDGREIATLSGEEARSLWGREIAMVFQDPMTALNPVMRVGRQITEALQFHLKLDKRAARDRALELLRLVGIPEPEQRLRAYPHELSGGMRQRICIAMAISCDPKLLLADEPTTALDVTIQRQILDLLGRLRDETEMAMVLVTHDLGVVAGRTDRVIVMYAGRVVEMGPTMGIYTDPRHPYTDSLLAAIPRLEKPGHTRLVSIAGRPVDVIDPKPMCRFAPRCRRAQPQCVEEDPPLTPLASDPAHFYACFYPIGSPEGDEALKANLASGHNAAGLELAERRRGLMAGSGTAHLASGHNAAGLELAGRGRGLMAGSGKAHLRASDDVLLRIEDLVVEYSVVGTKKAKVHAVSDISLDVRRGETLGLVGESGCGKSTAGRAIMMLTKPSSGSVMFEGQDLTQLSSADLRRTRRKLQMIFQDPTSSLNARRKVRDIVAEGLSISRAPKPWGDRVDEALLAVGLDPAAVGGRRPGELSGGQCQRIAIARALLLDPAVVICDEPVSALDVSVQAQILNLLEDMKARYSLTLLFIAHDLAVVKNVSDRVAVMYLGKLCEVAASDALYQDPEHPYTQALLSAIPTPDPTTPTEPMRIAGDLPSPVDPPSGCRFRTRCPRAQERCVVEEPLIQEVGPDHFVACHFPGAPEPAAAH